MWRKEDIKPFWEEDWFWIIVILVGMAVIALLIDIIGDGKPDILLAIFS